jgi:hypothetical protein
MKVHNTVVHPWSKTLEYRLAGIKGDNNIKKWNALPDEKKALYSKQATFYKQALAPLFKK